VTAVGWSKLCVTGNIRKGVEVSNGVIGRLNANLRNRTCHFSKQKLKLLHEALQGSLLNCIWRGMSVVFTVRQGDIVVANIITCLRGKFIS
jgi:hypothetical protein